MTSFEGVLRGEFFNPATFSGAIFYAIVFLFFAWLGARAIRFAAAQILKVQRGDQDLIDETTLTFKHHGLADLLRDAGDNPTNASPCLTPLEIGIDVSP